MDTAVAAAIAMVENPSLSKRSKNSLDNAEKYEEDDLEKLSTTTVTMYSNSSLIDSFFLCFNNKQDDTDDLILRNDRKRMAVFLIDNEPKITTASKILDFTFIMYPVRLPKNNCCCCCNKFNTSHPIVIALFAFWRISWFLSLVMGLNVAKAMLSGFCMDTVISTRYDNYNCPQVRSMLSNETDHQAKLEMSLLSKSGATFLGPSNGFRTSGTPFNEIFNQTYNNEALVEFLKWKAESGNTFSIVLFFLAVFSTLFLAVISVPLTLSLKFNHKDETDPDSHINELLYPPILDITDPESPKLIRKRNSVTVAMILWSFLLTMLLMTLMIYDYFDPQQPNLSFILTMIVTSCMSFSICTVMVSIVLGIMTHIHNSTVLANLLEYSASLKQTNVRRLAIEKWKKIYHATISSIHIHSWRTTPIVLSLIVTLSIHIAYNMTKSIFQHTIIWNDKSVSNDEKLKFTSSLISISSFAVYTTLLLLLFTLLAFVNIRFNRLSVLVSNLDLKELTLLDYRNMSKETPSFSVFDQNITPSRIVLILQLLFVQFLLLAIGAVGES
jgi:hypothetical protein